MRVGPIKRKYLDTARLAKELLTVHMSTFRIFYGSHKGHKEIMQNFIEFNFPSKTIVEAAIDFISHVSVSYIARENSQILKIT